MRFGGDVRGYGDQVGTTVTDVLMGLTNPAAAGQLALQAQTPQVIQGPPVNYTPIMMGGGALILVALLLKRKPA